MSECIEWAGTTFKKTGYGRRWFRGVDTTAHKAAFIEHHGREPIGLVRHACDNRLCYNVDHLVEGSFQDNSDDMVSRGRSRKGERHWNHKLTEEQISEILENRKTRAVTQRSLAKKFGVTESAITHVIKGRTWTKTTEKKTESIGR